MHFDTKHMRWNEKDGVGFLTFPLFEEIPFIRHAFSTRIGGISQNEFASMNLNFGRGDPRETVLENYRLFCAAAGLDVHSLVASAQDHHTVVRRVTKQEAGVGIWRPKDQSSVDGLITNEPDVTLVIYAADCVPLFFCDPTARAIGMAHAGWRGTVSGMARIMVEAMGREFGTRPENLLVGIGPSIGPNCYEVDEPVAAQFRALRGLRTECFLRPVPEKEGKFLLNLWEVNRLLLLQAGVRDARITVSGLCTRCNSGWLFSHRATGGKRGGLAGFLCLRPRP